MREVARSSPKKESSKMNLIHIKADFKNARIKSAIEKGKQTMLSSDSGIKGASLSKFEHRGKDGNLVVYTQDGTNKGDKPMNYRVIASFRPPDSLQNQLFFAEESLVPVHSRKSGRTSQSQNAFKMKANQNISRAMKTQVQTVSRVKAIAGLPKLGKADGVMREQLDSFEQVLTNYQSKRQREKRILGLGDEHMELADKLGRMYIERKMERNKLRAGFSISENVRQQFDKEDGKRVQFTQGKDKSEVESRVQETTDGRGSGAKAKKALNKRDRRLSKVPPNKRQKKILPKLSRKDLLANMELLREPSNQHETVSLKLPKI